MSERLIALEEQGQDESKTYEITILPAGSAPSSVVVTAYDVAEDGTVTDVSSTVLSGTPVTVEDVITTPAVIDLTADHLYRIEIKFSSGGNVYEPFLLIQCRR